jgi:hypothetical protein
MLLTTIVKNHVTEERPVELRSTVPAEARTPPDCLRMGFPAGPAAWKGGCSHDWLPHNAAKPQPGMVPACHSFTVTALNGWNSSRKEIKV